MDVQANLNICWSHRSYCRFCRALAHMEILVYCVIRIYPKYSNTITLYHASPKFEQFHFDYLSMCRKTAGLWTVQTLIRMWHLIWVYIVSLTLSVRISRVIMVCHYHLKTRYVLWSFFNVIIGSDKRGYQENIFHYENICCGYSLEAPRWGASNEYHNICFGGEERKISILFFLLKKKKVLYLELCVIDRKKIWAPHGSNVLLKQDLQVKNLWDTRFWKEKKNVWLKLLVCQT